MTVKITKDITVDWWRMNYSQMEEKLLLRGSIIEINELHQNGRCVNFSLPSGDTYVQVPVDAFQTQTIKRV